MSSRGSSRREFSVARSRHAGEVLGALDAIRGHRMAKAAIEMAAWDLDARQRGEPLWRLLGGSGQAIVSGVSIGIQDSVDDLLERVERELAAGYRRIKIKIKPGWDVDVVERVRARLGPIPLMVDANGAYRLEDAAHLAALDDHGLMMIEQPLEYDDIADHARLQARLRTPVCLDESIHSARDARVAIEAGACRIVNIKPGRVGGHAESIRVHDVCAARDVPVWHGGHARVGHRPRPQPAPVHAPELPVAGRHRRQPPVLRSRSDRPADRGAARRNHPGARRRPASA